MNDEPDGEGPAARCARLHAGLARFPAELFQFDVRIRSGWPNALSTLSSTPSPEATSKP